MVIKAGDNYSKPRAVARRMPAVSSSKTWSEPFPSDLSILETVGIAIVSHSAAIARGTADVAGRIVGDDIRIAFYGAESNGEIDVLKILEAIESAWSSMGVVILVDLGGTEAKAESAIEMLPAERRDMVVICNAPIVEGSVMAATAAASGSTLAEVRRAAEELLVG
jgi:dihydroxyacetone kinase DhaKLM complex PTS-EIIA-like component DhaM